MKKILIPLMIFALACFCFPAAAETAPLAFDAGVNRVFEGETLQTVLIRNGDASEGEVTYESSSPKIATVDGSGAVTGVTKGKVTITATLKTEKRTYQARLNLTVARKVNGITLDTTGITVLEPTDEKVAGLLSRRENEEENALPVILLSVKKSFTVKVSLTPKDATDRSVSVTAGEGAPFAVKQTTVTGTEPGEGILTVSSAQNPEVSQRYRVLVIQPVTKLTAVASAPAIAVGEQMTLTAEVTPENATVKAVTWKSENEKIASVTPEGVVTGLAKGNARIVGTALDGSKIRVNTSVKVVQKAEEITFQNAEVTLDTGKTVQLRATVLPKTTDDKTVTWSSSDESIASVDSKGKVTAVSLGDCDIICASALSPEVKGSVRIHVQQPVKAITLNGPFEVWVGETATMTATVEPANASNTALKMTSGNKKILDVTDAGVMTPLKAGETTVSAVSTDGSNRKARAKVRVLQHVQGVHMLRHTAYIDPGETSSAGAVLEPKDASNHTMTWESEDSAIASVSGDSNRVKITGNNRGITTITGTTQDGGFKCTLTVKIGDWEKTLKLTKAGERGGDVYLTVENTSSLKITRIKAEVSVFNASGNPVPACKDGGNTFTLVYKHTLPAGGKTKESNWQVVDYKEPDDPTVSEYVVKIVEFEIENDWVKVIRKKNQPTKKIPVHL